MNRANWSLYLNLIGSIAGVEVGRVPPDESNWLR